MKEAAPDRRRELTKYSAAGMLKPEGRCCITGGRPIPLRKGVVHFPEIVSKGGDADVEKTAVRSTPVSGVPGLLGLHTDHKSVLTVRLVPERSTISVD